MDTQLNPASVLIADNDVAVNSLLSAILEDRGLRCESVHDGEQALALLGRGSFRVLVTDLDMPNLDGHELLARLSDSAPNLAAVVISGYLDASAESELRSMPAVRHILRKPFDVVEFSDLVVGIVGQRGSDDPEPESFRRCVSG